MGSLDEPGKAGKVLVRSNSNAAYADGRLLYLKEDTLMSQPFDLRRLEATGEAVPVAEGILTVGSPNRQGVFSVSANGLMVFQAGGAPSSKGSSLFLG